MSNSLQIGMTKNVTIFTKFRHLLRHSVLIFKTQSIHKIYQYIYNIIIKITHFASYRINGTVIAFS